MLARVEIEVAGSTECGIISEPRFKAEPRLERLAKKHKIVARHELAGESVRNIPLGEVRPDTLDVQNDAPACIVCGL